MKHMTIYGLRGFNVRTCVVSLVISIMLRWWHYHTLSLRILVNLSPFLNSRVRWSWHWQRFALCWLLIKIGSLCDTLRQISCSPDMSVVMTQSGNMSVSVNLSPACDGVWWLQTPDSGPRCCLDVTSWIRVPVTANPIHEITQGGMGRHNQMHRDRDSASRVGQRIVFSIWRLTLWQWGKW